MYKYILFIIVIFNLLCMCKTWEEHITYYYGDLIEFNVNINERHKIKTLSYNDVLLYLFNYIDLDGNNFLDYREMYIYQYRTEPNIKLSYMLFTNICKLLDVNNILHYPVGLTMQMLNASYSIYKNELGTDIYKDFTTVLKRQRFM